MKVSLTRSIDALDRIAHSDEAVFALDANFLVILWNRGCERLLGRPAYQVLGHRCYDILCGRDVYGNRYCGTFCPVAAQARLHPEEPIRTFLADVPAAGGIIKRLKVSTFAIPAIRASIATLVHVLRDPARVPTTLERDLEQAVAGRFPVRRPPRNTDERVPALTHREQETLRRMSQGLPTHRIAKEMRISPVTVRNHIARILTKLDVHTKFAAVAFAYRNGLIGPEISLLPAARPVSRTETGQPRTHSQSGAPPRARPGARRYTRGA